MEAGPHPLIERIVGALCPPVAREAVMGDLAERYRTQGQYLAEAVSALPLVILGQVHRTTTLAVFGIQAVILFGCMGGFGDRSEAVREIPMWVRAAVPSALALFALVLRDAYRPVDGWSAGRALRDVITVTSVVALCQLVAGALAAAGAISPDWIFAAQRMVVMVISILPTLFVFRSGLGLDGDSRLQEPPDALSAAALRADYARFATRVRTRNLLEAGIFGSMALAGGAFLIFAQGLGDATLGWCWAAGQLVVSWYLVVRGSAASFPDHAAFGALVSLYRTEMARQQRLVRVIWWWYLWPLCIGVGLPLIGRGAENVAFAAAGFAAIALTVALVARFGRDRARDFQEEMDILSAIEERA